LLLLIASVVLLIAVALLLFNTGVEVGQLAFIAVVLGLIALSLSKTGESYAGTPGLPELVRYGHFTSLDRSWERIEF
jgi:hypothetical protein